MLYARDFFISISRRQLLFCLCLLLLAGCATQQPGLMKERVTAYRALDSGSLAGRFAPVFVAEHSQLEFNRIGTPAVEVGDKGRQRVYVDPGEATIYHESRTFRTDKAVYTNHLYRVHFQQVPFSLVPFHIGQGRNVGLITVVTTNSQSQPVLYTTVHTCGCYIAFLPTAYLADDALPTGWQKARQRVFGHNLPGLLPYAEDMPGNVRLLLFLQSGTHRVRDARLAPEGTLARYPTAFARLRPMVALESLPVAGGETSFFESSGARRGYVKGSHKFWERLLMSWWSLDWRIGEDKRLGSDKQDGPVFYTSIKPWARQASDMRDFSGFLQYWGWDL